MIQVDLDSLDKLEAFSQGENFTEYRFMVEVLEVDIPVLVRLNKSHLGRLLVTYNGAIQRSKAPDGVVFQRSSWLDEIDSCVVQICDPTLVKWSRLQIGWGQYSKNQWAIDSYKKLLDHLRKAFHLADPSSTVHYGSSAGGFQAACTSGLDRGSKAVINNPQLDWSRYTPQFVNALLRDVFEGEDIDSIPPSRINAIKFFESLQYVPKLEIYTNLSSDGDFENQLEPSIHALRSLSSIGKLPKVSIHCYSDPGMGHNPLGKPFTLGLLNNSFTVD